MRILKSPLLALLLTALCGQAFSQKNVIKTRPLRTIITSAAPIAPIQLNLTYERVIIPKLSAAITVNYGLERDLNTAVEFLDLDQWLNETSASSFGISPEVRLYPGLKKTPRGIYLMAEFFFQRSNLNTFYDLEYTPGFTLPDNSTFEYTYRNTYELDGNFTTVGGGIGVGSQWLFGDRLSVDILWFGIGIGNRNYDFSVDGALIDKERIIQDMADGQSTFSEQEIRDAFDDSEVPTWQDMDDQFAADILDVLDDFGIEPDREIRSDGITVAWDGLAIRPRFLHFAIGFAF